MTHNVTFARRAELGFELDGQALTVRAADMAQILAMLDQAKPLIDEAVLMMPDLFERLQAGAKPTVGDVLDLLDMARKHGRAALELVAIATPMPLAEVERLLPDRFAYLFAVIVQVNADFFAAALPALRAAGAAMERAGQAAPAGSATMAGPSSSTS